MPYTTRQSMKQRVTFGKFQNIDLRVAKVVSAPVAQGTANPSRVITLDLGHLGTMTSVGQYSLIEEDYLVGKNVIAVVNFAPRDMGDYTSEVLVLGAKHPGSPDGQDQALPLTVDDRAIPGDVIF